MTTPLGPRNNLSIPGGALKAKTEDDTKNTVSIPVGMTLDQAASRTAKSLNFHLNSLTDNRLNPKYMIDPSVQYFGNGSLSLLNRAGQLVYTLAINEPNHGIFRLDQEGSHMFSNAKTTILGDKEVETLQGEMMHPLGGTTPSTSFSPKKTWLKQLFPISAVNNILLITLLELVQYTLFKAIESSKKSSTNVEDSEEIVKDLGTIIVDNEEEFL